MISDLGLQSQVLGEGNFSSLPVFFDISQVASPCLRSYVPPHLPITQTIAKRRPTMAFELPELPYDYEALQPFMSKETLEFHHDKHHKAYVDNGNKLAAEAGLSDLSLEDVVKKSFGTNAGLFNNDAQHYNHVHFWKWMKKGGGGNKLPSKLEDAINSDLGGYDKFKADFIAAGTTQFGSGWAWVSVKNGKLEISKTPNGENPLVHGATPILGVDVWEHSYYIDYRNARPKYLEAFVDSLINWDYVLERYEAAAK
jgi:Fe-Mn family superoxide dismutase